MEKVINQTLLLLSDKFNNDQLQSVKLALSRVLQDYDISPKETHLVPADYYLPEEYKVYIVSKRIEGKSNKTLSNYDLVLRDFFMAMNKPLKNITTNDIRLYLYQYQEKTNISNASLDSRRIIINVFFNWLVDNDYIEKNPCRQIKAIKSTTKERQPLSEEEFEILRKSISNSRDKALIEFLASTACRVSECVSVNIGDVDFTSGELKVIGKGQKERKIYLTPRAKLALQDYLATRHLGGDMGSQPLFCSNIAPYGRLSSNTVTHLVARLGKEAGINRHVFPHLIRHTTATLALERGMDITDIQKMLGHSKIDTTLIYAKTSNAAVKASHHKYVS